MGSDHKRELLTTSCNNEYNISDLSRRFITFHKKQSWPHSSLLAAQLAVCGFIYIPNYAKRDRVYCPYCGLTIHRVHPVKDIIKRHIKLSTRSNHRKCKFALKLNKQRILAKLLIEELEKISDVPNIKKHHVKYHLSVLIHNNTILA